MRDVAAQGTLCWLLKTECINISILAKHINISNKYNLLTHTYIKPTSKRYNFKSAPKRELSQLPRMHTHSFLWWKSRYHAIRKAKKKHALKLQEVSVSPIHCRLVPLKADNHQLLHLSHKPTPTTRITPLTLHTSISYIRHVILYVYGVMSNYN